MRLSTDVKARILAKDDDKLFIDYCMRLREHANDLAAPFWIQQNRKDIINYHHRVLKERGLL